MFMDLKKLTKISRVSPSAAFRQLLFSLRLNLRIICSNRKEFSCTVFNYLHSPFHLFGFTIIHLRANIPILSQFTFLQLLNYTDQDKSMS